MSRVLQALEGVRTSGDPEAIHRLRVALRRCRSLAAAMETVDPHPSWQDMRRLSRRLFRRLGALRDTHVQRRGVRKLTAAGDALRPTLLKVLKDREGELRNRVLRDVKRFDRRAWKRLDSTLAGRARLVPPNGLAARCLALERYDHLCRLHARTVGVEDSARWHELRIAVKGFRYAVECFLPARFAVWEAGLRQTQDLLGEIHDLDVLEAFVEEAAGDGASGSAASLGRSIRARRGALMERYRQRAPGPRGLLKAWGTALPRGAQVEAAVSARLRAAARAMDPHPRRTVQIARLALRLFDALLGSRRNAGVEDGRSRLILRTAAELRGIRVARGDASRRRAARRILSAVRVPPNWTPDAWAVIPLIVRYHRGAEPRSTHGDFARLPKSHQDLVRGLAGTLRLARALHRAGARLPPGGRATNTARGVRLRLRGLSGSRGETVRLAAATHLLDTSLQGPLIIVSGEAASPQRNGSRRDRH